MTYTLVLFRNRVWNRSYALRGRRGSVWFRGRVEWIRAS